MITWLAGQTNSVLEFLGQVVAATGTVLAAVVVGVLGGLIAASYQRRRDAQDKESEWRSHAIELTKLDAQRKLKAWKDGESIRPFILDFLANYRDLQELGEKTPGELYLKIKKDRISKSDDSEDG
jgi:hypothetical protein